MKKILLIYTGGTIGMVRKSKNSPLEPFDFQDIINKIPELRLLDADISYVSFNMPIDSSDMNISKWQELAWIIESQYEYYDGFVILHGTDTMAWTAAAISFMVSGLKKPIIFTGSQLPMGDLRTDAKENLITSIHYAVLESHNLPIIQEVCIYFEYKLFRANRTTKYSTGQFDAFRSPNFPPLGQSGVKLETNKSLLFYDNQSFSINTGFSDQVILMKIFPNMELGLYLDFLIKNDYVLIMEVFGSGNIPDNKIWTDFLYQLSDLKRNLVVISQCMSGETMFGNYKNSLIFKDIHAVNAYDMTKEAIVTKAMLLKGNGLSHHDFKEAFEKNLKGEISIYSNS